MKITIHEKEPSIVLQSLYHLDQLIDDAGKQAKEQGLLAIIILHADNDDSIGFVVGGDETVLNFTYGQQTPPYYASKGEQNVDQPIMTCFLLFQHHTEFSRKHIIPFTTGMAALHEFYELEQLPVSIEWMEV